MKTVLIGWELGAGRGHAERLVPIVTAYRAKGWKVIAALRDARLGADVLGPHQSASKGGHLTIMRAPIFSHTGMERGPVHSLAEILAKTGFDKPALVRPLIAGWEAILTRCRPDLAISDSAPSLNIVARGRIPLIVIGNGWTVPPDIDPPAIFVPAPKNSHPSRVAADAVLSVMRAAVSNVTPVAFFSDLLRGDVNFVCSLGETDPYRHCRTERLYWPFEIAAPAAVPPDERFGGLIYLPKNHQARSVIEQQAAHLGMRFDAFFNEGQERVSPNLFVHDRPMDFASVIPRKRVVVHHGGLGTAIWCMVNQVPQIIFPGDLEKLLIAKGIVEGGFGIAMPPGTTGPDFTAAVGAASTLEVPKFRSHRMATLSPDVSIEALISVGSG